MTRLILALDVETTGLSPSMTFEPCPACDLLARIDEALEKHERRLAEFAENKGEK